MERRNVYDLFERQSERGNAYASWKLWMMHAMGRDCVRSTERSMHFLERSVEQGSPLGKRDLALAALRGMTQTVSVEQAYAMLIEVMRLGMHKDAAKALLQSGNPDYEKLAVDALRKASFARSAFEERMLVAMYDAMQTGLPSSKGELYAFLHEINRGQDRSKAILANRALWLADATAMFMPLQNPVEVVAALVRQPDAESKIDAYELARSIPAGCPAELKAATVVELSIAAALGNKHAKLILLAEAVSNAEGEIPSELTHQVYDLIRENPALVNEHVVDMFTLMQTKNPESAQEHMDVLIELESEGLPNVRSALATAALHIGLSDWTEKIMLELINRGDVHHFEGWVHLQLRAFKNGHCDAETALFWAECWQQDNHEQGLAAVSEVYEAMGPQTNEQKLAHFQVLDERAGRGDFEAVCDLGLLLLEGNSAVLSNKHRAFELLKMAARSEVPRAMYQLGLCHLRGIGTSVDEDLGHFWISQAAAKGYSKAKLQADKKEATEQASKQESDDEEETVTPNLDDGGARDEQNGAADAAEAIKGELAELKSQIVELVTYRKKQADDQEANQEGA